MQGGNRKGAGRPPNRGERKLTTSIRVTPTLKNYLADMASASETIETAIRRSADFRKWSKSQ